MRFQLKLIVGLIVTILLFGLGLFVGYKLFKPTVLPAPIVNAQVILTALHNRGFLVTQTYIFDEPITITKSTGSAFKDLFLGQTITARGTMEVNLGIDLAQVKAEDVQVTDQNVSVRIPRATLFNSRLVGPIELKNKQGVLKQLFDSDDGYNEALTELSKNAEKTAKRQDLMDRANDQAKEQVGQLLKFVLPGKTMEVTQP